MHGRTVAVVRSHLRIAVVSDTDDEQVLPLRSSLETCDKATQLLIEVGEGIRHRSLQTLIWHVKGLVTAEREHRLAPRLPCWHTHNILVEDIEGRAIRHAPIRPW